MKWNIKSKLAKAALSGSLLLSLYVPAASAAPDSVNELQTNLNAIYAQLDSSEQGILNDAMDAVAGLDSSLTAGIWDKIDAKLGPAPDPSYDEVNEDNILALVKLIGTIYQPGGDIGAVTKPTLQETLAQLAELAEVDPLSRDDLAAFILALQDELLDSISGTDFAGLLDLAKNTSAVKTKIEAAVDTVMGSGLAFVDLLTQLDVTSDDMKQAVTGIVNAVDPDKSAMMTFALGYGRSVTPDQLYLDPANVTSSTHNYDYFHFMNLDEIPVALVDWSVTDGSSSITAVYDDAEGYLHVSNSASASQSAKITAKFAPGTGALLEGKTLFTQTLTLGAASSSSSGGDAPVIPGPVDSPVTAPEELSSDKIDGLKDQLNNPVAGEEGQSATENEIKLQAAKAAESAIREAATVDASSLVTTKDGVSTVALTADSMQEAFESVKAIADQVNGVLKENDPNAAPAKVVVTIDLGSNAGDNLEVPLSQELVNAAKEQGIDAIAVEVNGVTLEIDISTLGSDTTMTVKKQDASVLGDDASVQNVSDVYSFEFTDPNGDNVNFSKPVTINLPVGDVSGVNTNLLVLAKIVDGGLEYYGGKYNGDGSFTATRSSFSSYVVVENVVKFKDIDEVQAWAGEAIETSASKGIINGRGDGVYDPQGDVTRAEFATLLVKALGLQNDQLTENFDDVSDGEWYQPYVAAAVNAGLVNGRTDKVFDPNAKISRDEIATMTANALKQVLGYSDVSDADQALAIFTDADSIRDFAKTSVALLTEEGLVKGRTDTTYEPAGYATRAEAAVLIFKLFNLI